MGNSRGGNWDDFHVHILFCLSPAEVTPEPGQRPRAKMPPPEDLSGWRGSLTAVLLRVPLDVFQLFVNALNDLSAPLGIICIICRFVELII